MNFGIIAAGQGSRLAQGGVAVPKPLVDINGRPMLGRLLDIMEQAGARHVTVVTNPDMPEVGEYLRHRAAAGRGPQVHIIERRTPGSMHSFREVAAAAGAGKLVVTTVDTVFDEDEFCRYVTAYAADDSRDGFMAVTGHIDDEKPLYVATDTTGRITAFRDAAYPGARYVSAGIYGLDPATALPVLDACMASGVNRMRNFQRALLSAGLRLHAWPMGMVLDVDHADDIEKAKQFLNGKK